MNHTAIRNCHPSVVTIDDAAGAFDADGNPVAIDEVAVEVEMHRLAGEQQKRSLEAAIDQHINDTARVKGYDNRVTCALRAGYPNPWHAECLAFGQWMDSCYATFFTIMADVESGARPIPTVKQLIDELPASPWAQA
jgi:hypothetical protein